MQSKTQLNPSGKPRGGRPTKAATARRRILETGVDPALVDPRRILAGIAVDADAPATARVAAAKALMLGTASLMPQPEADPDDAAIPLPPEDVLTQRALALLAGGRPQ